MLDFRDVITDPLLQSGKQDAIDALRKAGALVSQPSDSEGNPWDGDSNNTYDYIDHIQMMTPADEAESHFEEDMYAEERQFWKEYVRDHEPEHFEFDDEDFLQ